MSYFYYQSKRIYYEEKGCGEPVMFLHGNTALSRMFELLMPLYEEHFHVILMDFLGHGRSDRLERFPADLWQQEAAQTIALLEHLKLGKVNLAGTSGGAWVAINAALERPDLVGRMVADSFDGRTLGSDFAKQLIQERMSAKQDENAAGFYEWCQGADWERVVDLDTEALLQCASEKLPLFTRPLSELQVPLLLMGSQEDEMSRSDFVAEYQAIAAETGARIKLFQTGRHPAILSNAEQAAAVICEFFK